MVTPRSTLFPLVSLRRVERLLDFDRATLARVAARAGSYYDSFDIQKAHGSSTWRHIDNPQGELKEIQRRIRRAILSTVPLPPFVLGGVRGRSISDNAQLHVRKAMVVTLDLQKCFPRTRDRAIFGVFLTTFGCSPKIAGLLLKLTTLHHRLPQGAPTSTDLANLALLPLHYELHEIALRVGFDAYSAWVDNLTFSGPGPLAAINEQIIPAIHRYGYAVHEIEPMPACARQFTTGVTLNVKPSVGRDRIQAARGMIFRLSGSGGVSHRDELRLNGMIQQMSQVCPEQARGIERLALRRLPTDRIDQPSERVVHTRPCRGFRTQPH